MLSQHTASFPLDQMHLMRQFNHFLSTLPPPPDLSQHRLNQKIQTFLSYLPREDTAQKQSESQSIYGWPVKGLCHGYSVMMLRADLLGDLAVYMARLKCLAGYDEQRLWLLATTLLIYQQQFRQNTIAHAQALQQALQACQGNKQRERATRRHFFDVIQRQSWTGVVTKEAFETADDLYTFIQSLLSAQMPVTDMSYLSGNIPLQDSVPSLSQYHLTDILSRLQVETSAEERLTPGQEKLRYILQTQKEPWALGFLVSRKELLETLDKIIFEGDHAVVLGDTHDVYLSKQGGVFRLGESNDPTLLTFTDSSATVVDQLIYNLYHRFDQRPSRMAIGFLVLATRPNPRPRPVDITQDILQSRGIDKEINGVSTSHFTALAMAANFGCDGIVKQLLEQNADPAISIQIMSVANTLLTLSPVCLAAMRGFTRVVEVLLMFNVTASLAQNAGNASNLESIADANHQSDVVRLLDQFKALVTMREDSDRWTTQGRFDSIGRLTAVELEAAVNAMDIKAAIVSAVRQAVGSDMRDCAHLNEILRMGFHYREMLLYYLARFMPSSRLAQYVCEHQLENPDDLALHVCLLLLAQQRCDVPSFTAWLIQTYGLRLSQLQLYSVLRHLLALGDADNVVRLLILRPDAYVNACDVQSDRNTLLHQAVLANQLEIVRALCLRGANVTMENAEQQTALSLACAKGYYPIVIYLLDHYQSRYTDRQRLQALATLCKSDEREQKRCDEQIALAKRLLTPALADITDLNFLKHIPGDYKQQRQLAVSVIQQCIDQATTPGQVLAVINTLDELKADLGYLYERRSKVAFRHYRYGNAEVSPKWLQIVASAQKRIVSLLSGESTPVKEEIKVFLAIPVAATFGLFSPSVGVFSHPYHYQQVSDSCHATTPLLGRPDMTSRPE